jgi:hypothetical protein
MADSDASVSRKAIVNLAEEIIRDDGIRQAEFIGWLEAAVAKARGKEFLLVHNPGGWGNTVLEDCLDWERSIVEGIIETMSELGRSWTLVQYFRSGNSFWRHMRDIRKEAAFFLQGKSSQARAMAAGLRFLLEHLQGLRVVLVGASQGAAFSNAVMRHLGGYPGIYSIELGIFFPHMGRRVITERTLAIDSNGLMPDPMCNRNLLAGFRAYITAPYRWVNFKLQGNPQRFTYCINAPGHDYNWEYPEVHGRVEDFLRASFGNGN